MIRADLRLIAPRLAAASLVGVVLVVVAGVVLSQIDAPPAVLYLSAILVLTLILGATSGPLRRAAEAVMPGVAPEPGIGPVLLRLRRRAAVSLAAGGVVAGAVVFVVLPLIVDDGRAADDVFAHLPLLMCAWVVFAVEFGGLILLADTARRFAQQRWRESQRRSERSPSPDAPR